MLPVAYRLIYPPPPIRNFKQEKLQLILAAMPASDRTSTTNRFDLLIEASNLLEEFCTLHKSDIILDSGDGPRYTGVITFADALDCPCPSDRWTPQSLLDSVHHDMERAAAPHLLDLAAAATFAVFEYDPSESMFSDKQVSDRRFRIIHLHAYCLFRANLFQKSGDQSEALRSLNHADVISAAFLRQADTMSLLCGRAMRARELRIMRNWATNPRGVEESLLNELASRLTSMEAPPTLSRVARGDRLRKLELLQSTCAGAPPPRPDPNGQPASPTWPLRWLFHREMADRNEDYYDIVEQWVDAPRDTHAQWHKRAQAELDRAGAFNALFGESVEDVEQLMNTRDGLLADIRATHCVVAIESFRLRHDRLPASLDELVPSELPELPRDPFRPEESFVYRLQPRHAVLRPNFVLYSVGANRIDDEGRPTPPCSVDPDDAGDLVYHP